MDIIRIQYNIIRMDISEEAAKGAQMGKISNLIFNWLHSTEAYWDADMGKPIIFLQILFFHVYCITG